MLTPLRGEPQQFRGLATFDILAGKEAGEILSGDLLESAARHALRAGIPASDLSERAQHQDRVILDTRYEQPVFAFTFLHRFLCHPASGIVALDTQARGNRN